MMRRSPVIVVSEANGRPYTPGYFRRLFRKATRLAGVPDNFQFRDYRRTAATELGGSGATDDEIRSVTGHRSRDVVSVYVLPTDRTAANAQAKRWKKEPERNGKVGK